MVFWCDIDSNAKNLIGGNGENGFIKIGKNVEYNFSFECKHFSTLIFSLFRDKKGIICTLKPLNTITPRKQLTKREALITTLQREKRCVALAKH